jgi:predicted transposase YbfD/YdcC
MTADQELSLAHHFAELTDPRIDRSRLHELLDIVAIAICAVVAGADSWDDIEDFGNAKHDWLKTFLDCPTASPRTTPSAASSSGSTPTSSRGLPRLDRGAARGDRAAGRRHRRQDAAPLLRPGQGQVGPAPGPRLGHGQPPAAGPGAVDEKSNEITAIPKLLKMLAISGAIVTIDAMGCQKEIARTIRGREADYILALKANHEHLFEQVVAFWDRACARLRKGPDIRYHREWSEGHGRTEARRCWATSDLTWLEGGRSGRT